MPLDGIKLNAIPQDSLYNYHLKINEDSHVNEKSGDSIMEKAVKLSKKAVCKSNEISILRHDGPFLIIFFVNTGYYVTRFKFYNL